VVGGIKLNLKNWIVQPPTFGGGVAQKMTEPPPEPPEKPSFPLNPGCLMTGSLFHGV